MKPLHAGWLIDIYNELSSFEGRKVILGGWKGAGITDAIAKGLIGFTGESMDPFYDFNPFDQVDIPIETACTQSFSSEEYINPEREDESDVDDQYLPGVDVDYSDFDDDIELWLYFWLLWFYAHKSDV